MTRPSRAEQRAARDLADQLHIGYAHALAIVRGAKPMPARDTQELTDDERALVLQAIADFLDAVQDMVEDADRDECDRCDGTGVDPAAPGSRCESCDGSGLLPTDVEVALDELDTAVTRHLVPTVEQRELLSDVLGDYQGRVEDHCEDPRERRRLIALADAAGAKLGV